MAPGTGPGREASLFDRRSMVEVGEPRHRAGLPVRCPPGRADRPAVAGAHRRHPEDHAGVRQHGQRRAHRLDRSADHHPLARVPRHLRGPQGPDRPGRVGRPCSSTSSPASPPASRSEAPLPAIRFTQAPAAWPPPGRSSPGQTPRVRVLFDNGAGAGGPGGHPVDVRGELLQLATGGHRSRRSTSARTDLSGGRLRRPRTSTTFTLDPKARPTTSLPASGNAWAADPDWDWKPVPAADGIGFQTAPFRQPTTIVGPATARSVGPGHGTGRGLPGHHHRSATVRRARRSTSPRDSCAARTRSTGPTPRRCSPTRPTWAATPGCCRRAPTRW